MGASDTAVNKTKIPTYFTINLPETQNKFKVAILYDIIMFKNSICDINCAEMICVKCYPFYQHSK